MAKLDGEPVLCCGPEAAASPVASEQWGERGHTAVHPEQEQLADPHVQSSGGERQPQPANLNVWAANRLEWVGGGGVESDGADAGRVGPSSSSPPSGLGVGLLQHGDLGEGDALPRGAETVLHVPLVQPPFQFRLHLSIQKAVQQSHHKTLEGAQAKLDVVSGDLAGVLRQEGAHGVVHAEEWDEEQCGLRQPHEVPHVTAPDCWGPDLLHQDPDHIHKDKEVH